MDATLVINLIGWLGSAAVIAAYLLVSTNRLKGDAVAYQLLNLVGGVFLVINTIFWGAYPSTFVNLVWIGIAVFTMARVVKK